MIKREYVASVAPIASGIYWGLMCKYSPIALTFPHQVGIHIAGTSTEVVIGYD